MSFPILRIGCAGWSIPKASAERFPNLGSHLERYAHGFTAVEINSSFYRPHRPETYARWADSVPEGFQFSLKIPKDVTHRHRLHAEALPVLEAFLASSAALGAKRGPLLIQLPPSLIYEEATAAAFFANLRERYAGPAVCEPRHPSWFESNADALLRQFQIARVAADPAVVPAAAEPGGAPDLVYVRWHGSPRLYYSRYSEEQIAVLALKVVAQARSADVWCIFDNTAAGAATENAWALKALCEKK